MLDKDLDSLFRSKFDDFKVEPSSAVWNGLASQTGKKKKPLGGYLSIAASLLILLGAGLYFVLNIKETIKKPVQIANAKNNTPPKAIIQPVTATLKGISRQNEKNIPLNSIASHKPKKHIVKNAIVASKQEKDMPPQTQLSQVIQPVDKRVNFVVPDRSVPFNDKIEIPQDESLKTNTLARVQDAPVSKTLAAAPVKKHRIRNFGDLINAVVSKVDKRKDKLIEFSSPKDEDESTLSGLNLGFIKIKKTEE